MAQFRHPGASTALTAAPVLAHVVRSGVVESVHRGVVAVTDPSGAVEHAWGDPYGVILPRSAAKPLQAVGMLGVGLDLPGPLLALACASHAGEEYHLDAARAILASAGLTEEDLQNTPDYPLGDHASEAWIRAGRPRASVAQNCSGKHAAMLVTAVRAGWDPRTYLDPAHPVQQAIAAAVERLTDERIAAVTVDGCGAPLHGIPAVGLARAFARLASAPAATDEGRVADAMRAHPEYVGGTGRPVTALLRGVPGLVAKEGAESVYAAGLPDGRGVAVKIADGHPRAKSVVLAAVLRRLGIMAEPALEALEHAPVLGHGRPVGAVVAVGI